MSELPLVTGEDYNAVCAERNSLRQQVERLRGRMRLLLMSVSGMARRLGNMGQDKPLAAWNEDVAAAEAVLADTEPKP